MQRDGSNNCKMDANNKSGNGESVSSDKGRGSDSSQPVIVDRSTQNNPTFILLSSSSSSESSSDSSSSSSSVSSSESSKRTSSATLTSARHSLLHETENVTDPTPRPNGLHKQNRTRGGSIGSDGSFPPLHAHFLHQNSQHKRNLDGNDFPSDSATSSNGVRSASTEAEALGGAPAAVSADQERQILLLMLLAQVCALHDPTPRTFTVHVLELWERGVLDRSSINFLFELGLVPLLAPNGNQPLLTGPAASVASGSLPSSPTDETCNGDPLSSLSSNVPSGDDIFHFLDAERELMGEQKLAILPARAPLQRQISQEERRSLEASAIRSRLARLDEIHAQNQRQKKQKKKANRQSTAPTSPSSEHSPTHCAPKPWEVEHFPLSLSRYQREFDQVRLINAGAFGQVFHATSKTDGCDYAVKKVQFDATGYSDKAIQQVIREVQCLAQVNDHPNIVRYYTSWLEPSWMTGSASSSASDIGSGTGTIPQHRLLADLQQLMNSGDEQNGSNVSDPSLPSKSFNLHSSKGYGWESSSFSNENSFSYGLNRRHRRRFSFDNTVDSGSRGWESHHDWASSTGIEFARDDSFLPQHRNGTDESFDDRHRNADKPKPKQQPQQSPVYRYQICLFIQMQLCHPATLADWIRQRNLHIGESEHSRRIGPALEIFLQLTSGLAHIHKNGILHRDLKPANIFASNDGHVIKIGDFGLSKQLEGVSPGKAKPAKASSKVPPPAPRPSNDVSTAIVRKLVTEPLHSPRTEEWESKCDALVPILGAIRLDAPVSLHADRLTEGIGTASYASPEQLKSQSYGTSADIFSLGLIFLELLCCFETEHERLDHFNRCRRQQLPSWLEEKYPKFGSTILACTQPDPLQRPTAQAILDSWSVSPATNRDGTTIIPALHALRSQLKEKDEQIARHCSELAEKDRVIERMRQEMERMRSSTS